MMKRILGPSGLEVSGFKTIAQVHEDAGAMSLGPLSVQQMRQIDEILERVPVAS